MKKYTVIIPTTNNVVGINDIVKEDPLVSSVICENNNLEALPISPFYNSFVKSPTGIIEKLVGHPSFRIDITKPIHNGKSWQLAIAIAHIFFKNNILNLSNQNQLLTKKTEEIIWASGTINSNLEIKKINYLDQKIYNSMNFLKNCINNEVQINIVLSIQNKDDFNSLLSNNEFLKDAIKNKLIKVLFFNNLYDLFDHLNLKNILKKPTKRLSFFQKSKKTLSSLSIIFVTILFALMFNNVWQKTLPLLSFEGRFQFLNKGRIKNMLHKNEIILIDGAHATADAKNLAAYLKEIKIPKYGIWAMTKNKEPNLFIKQLKGVFKKVVTMPIETEANSVSSKELYKIAIKNKLKAEKSDSFTEALNIISNKEKKLIVCFGSLYNCGNILNKN